MKNTDENECTVLRNASLLLHNWYVPSSDRSGISAFQAGFFWLEVSLSASFLLIFAFYRYVHPHRMEFSRLQVRHVRYVLITHIGWIMVATGGSYFDSHDLATNMPCWYFWINIFLAVPCLTLPLMVRLLSFCRGGQFTKRVMVSYQIDDEQLSAIEKVASVRQYLTHIVIDWFQAGISIICGSCMSVKSSADAGESDKRGLRVSLNSNPAALKVMKFMTSEWGAALSLTLVFTPYFVTLFVVLGTSDMVALGCWGCLTSPTDSIVTLLEAIVALVLLLITYCLNLGQRDPFGILQEMRLIIWFTGLPCVILLALTTYLPTSSEHNVTAILLEIGLIFMCAIQSVLQCFLAVLDRSREKKIMLHHGMSKQEFEVHVLQPDSHYHEAFAQHLASEHSYESLGFLLAVQQFYRGYIAAGPKIHNLRARKIITMYVGENAVLACNLSNENVEKLLPVLDSLDHDVPRDAFENAKLEIINLLYRDAFVRFCRTKEYAELSATAVVALSDKVSGVS